MSQQCFTCKSESELIKVCNSHSFCRKDLNLMITHLQEAGIDLEEMTCVCEKKISKDIISRVIEEKKNKSRIFCEKKAQVDDTFEKDLSMRMTELEDFKFEKMPNKDTFEKYQLMKKELKILKGSRQDDYKKILESELKIGEIETMLISEGIIETDAEKDLNKLLKDLCFQSGVIPEFEKRCKILEDWVEEKNSVLSMIKGMAAKDLDQCGKEAFEGKIDFISQFLDKNPHLINKTDSEDRTLLYSACRGPFPNPEVIKLLLVKGADPLLPSKGSYEEYCCRALVRGLDELLNKEKDVGVMEKSLDMHAKAISILKSNGVELNTMNNRGEIPTLDLLDTFNKMKKKKGPEKITKLLENLLTEIQPTSSTKMYYITVKEEEDGKPVQKKIDVPQEISIMIGQKIFFGENPNEALPLNCQEITLFTPAKLEIQKEFRGKPNFYSVQICCLPEALGIKNVDWEQLIEISGSWVWVKVPEDLNSQLKTNPSSHCLQSNQQHYSLNQELRLKGNGPLNDTLLRWVPCFDLDVEEIGDSDDEVENEAPPNQNRISDKAVVPSFPVEEIKNMQSDENGDKEREESEFHVVSEKIDMKNVKKKPKPGKPIKQPPTKTLKINFFYENLKKQMIQIISALPTILNITKTTDFQWSHSHQAVSINCTDEQENQLNVIKDALSNLNKVIDLKRNQLEKIVREHVSATFKELRNNNYKLEKDDPVLVMIKEFNDVMKNLTLSIIEEAKINFKKELKNSLSNLVKECLEFPKSVDDPLKNWEKKVINYQRLKNCKIEALNTLFDKKIKDFPKDLGKQLVVLKRFIEKITTRAAKEFVLPILIRDFEIHRISAERGLPFYTETSEVLLKEISNNNDVIIVKTGTGSGKSTLMPLLVLAEGTGLNRIAVTQPRRFAAESICDALEAKHGKAVIGYRMAGKSRNPNANIVYYTDGLLRTILNPNNELPFDLIIIDEVHERSKEIDACIALLALIKKEGKVKFPKVILASATFDDAVCGPFKRAGAKVSLIGHIPPNRFKTTSHYPDKACNLSCNICSSLRTNNHYFALARILLRRVQGLEQILIFLPSQVDVMNAISLLESYNIFAKPLYAQQNGRVQLEYLKNGRIFVSTNIAETSITFPCLKYVIDSGKVLRQVLTEFGPKMETVDAPTSTLNQRKGRVGRTLDGDYIALYPSKLQRTEHIQPKFQLEGSNDIIFSLSLQLQRPLTLDFPLDPPNNSVELMKTQPDYKQYPNLGGESITNAFAKNPECRLNILCFASIRKTMTAKVSQNLVHKVSSFTKTKGDISTASALMMILVRTKFHNQDPKSLRFQVNNWCLKNSLEEYSHNLFRAYKDAMKMIEICKKNKVYLGSCDPVDSSPLINALASEHPNNIFLSTVLFKGPDKTYTRARDFGDGGDEHKTKLTLRTISTIHSKSLIEKNNCNAVLSLDFMLFDTDMKEVDHPYRLGVMQMCEEISIKELDNIKVERRIWIRGNELKSVTLPIDKIDDKSFVWFKGSIPSVVQRVEGFFKSIISEEKVELFPPKEVQLQQQFQEVIKDIAEAHSKSRLFKQLKFFWKNQYQADIEIHLKDAKPHFIIKAREADRETFKHHISFWCKQLHYTPVINDPEEWSLQTKFIKPAVSDDIRDRLAIVTKEDLKDHEIWDLCSGPAATRETRMAVVGRIALMKFDCRITGGFIRDWIIRGETVHPGIPFDKWVVKNTQNTYWKYDMIEGVVPKDLDIELSPNTYFSISRFISEVRSAGITVDFHEHIAQRHVFVFERDRGPFMADFIEHHFAALHTQSDFDTNALCLKSPFHNMLGMKVPLDISIDQIISTIKKKHFSAKRALDKNMEARKEKMDKRGWVYQGCFPYKPAEDTGKRSTILPLPDVDPKFKEHSDEITKIGGKNIKIYQIKNHLAEKIYEGLKQTIKNENGGAANEMELYHGTKEDAVTSIIHHGLDDRYWASGGYFGRGAYHAKDPQLSLSFTDQNPRTIFVCKVLMGKVHDLSSGPISAPLGAEFINPKGTHSVMGRIIRNGTLRQMEYIVYRFGQTQPIYMINFDV